MKSSNTWALGAGVVGVVGLLVLSACGQDTSTPAVTVVANLPNGLVLPKISGANVLPLTVNGSTCSVGSYANKPCVSIKICAPGSTTACMTVNDLLVDTGSYGIRIFKKDVLDQNPSVLNGLTQVMVGGKELATCAQFGDGSSDWGPVKLADVVLGQEAAVQIPIQVIDSTYASTPSSCPSPDVDPANTGFNGILGVGIFSEDCGSGCANFASNGLYFGCTGSSCSGTKVSLANQVRNPVAAQAVDNNGLILELPSIALGGTTSIEGGYLVLGIGTQANNTPGNVVTYEMDSSTGEFSTTFSGDTFSSFLDSGSNALYFPSPSNGVLPDCGLSNSSLSGWFCPPSTVSLSATNISSTSVSGAVPFYVANMIALSNSSNNVFLDLGGGQSISSTSIFDWGLPFYIGRNVYHGIENTTSSLGTGPYWAY